MIPAAEAHRTAISGIPEGGITVSAFLGPIHGPIHTRAVQSWRWYNCTPSSSIGFLIIRTLRLYMMSSNYLGKY